MEHIHVDPELFLQIFRSHLSGQRQLSPDEAVLIHDLAKQAMDAATLEAKESPIDVVDSDFNDYMSKKELMEALDTAGIDYTKDMRRDALLDLLKSHS